MAVDCKNAACDITAFVRKKLSWIVQSWVELASLQLQLGRQQANRESWSITYLAMSYADKRMYFCIVSKRI